MLLLDLLLDLYFGLLILLSLVALHRLYLALVARRLSVSEPLPPRVWPEVLVQVPLYNEYLVAERVIDAVCGLRYPINKLSIQILDDSTDGTNTLVVQRVQEWSAKGLNIVHIRRPHREDFKAGALAAGLRQSKAELVAIFDADFVPEADFLERLVPHFVDPKVGLVQARWGHLNRHDSLLTEAQAVLLDGHFMNEHGGRCALGLFFNFNGTAGIWRRTCIEDAGGWSGRTLTEDLDLSYRAQLRGWKFVYRPDVVVPAELPADSTAFKTQQYRWAKGSVETARYLLGPIWQTKGLSLQKRLQATLHLTGNFAYPLVLLLAILMPFVLNSGEVASGIGRLLLDAVFLLGPAGSLTAFYLAAERRIGMPWRCLKRIPIVLAIGIGLAINNTRAVVEAFLNKSCEFIRTPKRGDKNLEGTTLPWHAFPLHWQPFVEIGFGLYLVVTIFIALEVGQFAALPFLGIFATGFLILGGGSLTQTFRVRLSRAHEKVVTAP